MKIILVRHGESKGNYEKFLAYPDTPLTELGVKQAIECSERLKKFEIDKVYSSPFLRARQTCEEYTNEYVIEELLREQTTGLEGLNYDAYAHSPYVRDLKKNPLDAKAEDGESLREVYERALKLREKLHKEGGNILCFSHACFMGMLISTIFEDPLMSFNFVVKNARISVISEDNGSWYLEELNG